jgi:hypothetical protein
VDTLQNLLRATDWAMEKPSAYGLFHILVMLGGFSLCVLLAWRLRNVSERGNRIILLAVGLFLLVSEVYKQLFYVFVVQPDLGRGISYPWCIFPFQLVSIPLYFCLIAPLLKKGAVQKSLYNFLMTFNMLGGFIAFFEPSGLFHEYVTLTAHALIWHMMLVFVGVYLLLSGRGGIEKKDFLQSCAVWVVLCGIALTLNFSLWDVSGQDIHMFFLGPGHSSIIVFKQISQMFGWVVCTLVYIPIVALGAWLLWLGFRAIRLALNRRQQQKTVTL